MAALWGWSQARVVLRLVTSAATEQVSALCALPSSQPQTISTSVIVLVPEHRTGWWRPEIRRSEAMANDTVSTEKL